MANEMTQAKGDFLTNPQALTGKIVRQYLDPQGKATDEELAYFIATCKERNLNPFTKEVYFIKYGNNPAQIVVSKDAFMKRAEQNPAYDGSEAGVVYEWNGEIKYSNGVILPKGAELLGGWADVYRKDRSRPVRVEVELAPYNTGKSWWAKSPAQMIRKVALVGAVREAFSENVGGLYTTEEMAQAQPIDVTPKETKEDIAKRKMAEIQQQMAERESQKVLEADTSYPAEDVPDFDEETGEVFEDISFFEGDTTQIKD